MEKSLHEIDLLVATEIMGWRSMINSSGELVSVCCPPYWFPVSPPKYSSDIAAAWEVVEKLKYTTGNDGTFKLQFIKFLWICYWDHEDLLEGCETNYPHSVTAPLAICIAALKTKGIEVEVGEA